VNGKPHLVWVEGTEARPGLNGLWTFLDDYLKEQAGDEFDVSYVAFPRAAGGVRQLAPRLLSETLGLVAAQVAAEHDADLVIFNDWAMPIHAARAHLDIPVTGVAEASAVVGNVLAQRPAIVTVAEGLRWGFERDLRDFGLSAKMLHPPVWWLDPQSTHEDVREAVTEPAAFVKRFDGVAQRAVDAGADAILVGCGYLGPTLSHAGYTHVNGRPDIPVYDCTRMAFELGVLLHRLHRDGVGPSRVGFQQPPEAGRNAVADVLAHLQLVDGERKSLLTSKLGQ
jgi:Asp/Glu/hydantoin racemase